MKVNLVNWPEPDDVWQDSGEGGLYALLVVDIEAAGDPMRSTGECIVDCWPFLPVPDVCVNEPQGWWAYEQDEDPLLKAEVIAAAAFLGATRHALWSDEADAYYTVKQADLTPRGRSLEEIMRRIYGDQHVRILTFLDT